MDEIVYDQPFTPTNWYWTLADRPDFAWSSATRSYVPIENAPADRLTVIGTEAELRGALARCGHADRSPGYVPETVELWQARATLASIGKLTAATNAVAAANPELKYAWEYATKISRDSPAVIGIAAALGLSSTEVDQLFITASKLVAT